jgi:hypothetical protein
MDPAPTKLWKCFLVPDEDGVLRSLPIPHLVSHQADRYEYAAGSADTPMIPVDLDSPCFKKKDRGEDKKASASATTTLSYQKRFA